MHGIILVSKQLKRKAFTAIILRFAYAGTDKLFLPANNLDQLQKYIGNEGDVNVLIRWWSIGARLLQRQKSIDDLR